METNRRIRSERNQELEWEREVPLTVETKKGNIVNLIGCHTTPNISHDLYINHDSHISQYWQHQ